MSASQSQQNNTQVIAAFNHIPYSLISQELGGTASDIMAELTEIQGYYKMYRHGVEFTTEGSNGDYIAADLRYKLAATLINKQARFLFAESPDILVEAKGDVGKITQESKDALTVLNDLVGTVFDSNQFESMIVKAAKDCFIGKRVAGMVNFNEDDGVTIAFLPSTQFVFETALGNQNVLTKFIAFQLIGDGLQLKDKQILRKRFTLECDGYVYIEEAVFDGAGTLIQELTPKTQTLLDVIPVSIFVNDGLSGDMRGESEVRLLADLEKWFSKLSNADVDAERKSMNAIRYTIDMEKESTKNLSSGPGAYWDLHTDQNTATDANSRVGSLESSMNYSPALKTTLERIKGFAFEKVDIPMVSLDSMRGTITSGKALKAIYWPLIVRCKEKMKTWGPGLRHLVDIIIKGSYLYPDTVKRYISDTIIPVEYEIRVEQNTPLPEDEQEEKGIDLAEVSAQTMSRKAWSAVQNLIFSNFLNVPQIQAICTNPL